jgi:hypothetical protein
LTGGTVLVAGPSALAALLLGSSDVAGTWGSTHRDGHDMIGRARAARATRQILAAAGMSHLHERRSETEE